MEYNSENFYEVEKIITCKYFKSKKYYLIKWLCYPINQSTWESKENLKHLKYLIDEFEAQYPQTIDKCMYNIFCNEVKNKKKIKKKEKNKKTEKNIDSNIKFLSKKRNIETFYENELKDPYLNGLKRHLYIKFDKNHDINIQKKEDIFIDLRENSKKNKLKLDNSFEKETNENSFEESKQAIPKLIKPTIL